MDDVQSFVYDFFLERHIALKENWLSDVLSFLTAHLVDRNQAALLSDPSRIANFVYEQWKYADIEDTTYPWLKQLSISSDTKKIYLSQPVVLQINSIVDIGTSFYSQFSALVYEFVDNTGFEALPELEHGDGMKNLEAKPRRMLSFVVSDGETQLKAIEYHSIKSLSLLTPPGSKILLIPPILCRRGVLLLKPGNVQFLGGDVEVYFSTGRPLQVMSEKLKIPIPMSKKQTDDFSEPMRTNEFPVLPADQSSRKQDSEVDVGGSGGNDPIPYDDEGLDDGANNNEEDIDQAYEDAGVEDDDDYVPGSPVPGTSKFEGPCAVGDIPPCRVQSSSKPVAEIPPMKPTKAPDRRNELHNRISHLELEETPPDFEAELARSRLSSTSRMLHATSSDAGSNKARQSSDGRVIRERPSSPLAEFSESSYSASRKRSSNAASLLSLCESEMDTSGVKQTAFTPFDPSRRPVKLGIQGFLQPEARSSTNDVIKRETATENVYKKVKIEVIDLDDDDIEEQKVAALPVVVSSADTTQSLSDSLTSQASNPENELVTKFQRLNIVRLAEAAKQMRWAVGSSRKMVQAIILDIVDPLRIVDGLWTMKVTLQDESVDSFMCLVDSFTLSSLIGLTPGEAMEVRASSDVARRKMASVAWPRSRSSFDV